MTERPRTPHGLLPPAGRAPARRILAAGVMALALVIAPAAAQDPPPATSPLTVETRNGAHLFQVEMANTPAARRQGLMFRRNMALDHGMVFDFGAEHPVSMWMKNTLIPLDMLFIGGDGVIRRIAAMAAPHDTTPIPSGAPVRAVLEITGGRADALGIRPGDRVRHPMFSAPPP